MTLRGDGKFVKRAYDNGEYFVFRTVYEDPGRWPNEGAEGASWCAVVGRPALAGRGCRSGYAVRGTRYFCCRYQGAYPLSASNSFTFPPLAVMMSPIACFLSVALS